MKEPKIRFNEFKGEWNSSAIGDIATFSKGRGYSKSDLKAKGNPIILYGRMYTDYSFVIDSVETYATLQKGSVLSDGNEVVIPASGETPEDIAVASAVTMKNVILGGDLNILKFDKNKILSTFAAMQISCGRTRKELSNFAQGKTVVHLHNSNISKGHFCYPPIAEQHSIASFFTTLDAQISASTSRLASLKQIKAASLQAMFPQEGETVPKLRFKGFEGEWEYDEIGNICKITTGKSNTQDQVPDGQYPFFIRSEKIAKSVKYLYDTEAVITIGDGNIGKVFHYTKGKFDLHQRCYMMYEFQSITDAKYFYYYFSTHFYDRAIKMSAKATVDSVRLEKKKKMEIKYPSFNEQRAIASYFTNLDRQITLQSQRLEKLKQIKAACLDKMFV